ncbi:MAG: ABC transporter ATP-binding protein [Kineosporiaceae bacterium]
MSTSIELRIESVTHRIGDRTVLDGVCLHLSERRIGLIGLNGSGKSTLARLLNGLVVPTEGRVLVDGLDTARHAAAVRRRVGFVFTDPDAQIVMPTAGEDVAFSLRRRGFSRAELRAQAERTLERFGLAGHADSPAHLLSGGEKQLLALASVLVTEPALVICDEPTTLLDLRNARRVADLIAGLDPAVLLVTHHLDQLAGFDRVIVMHEGRVAADDSPAAAIAAYRRLAG